MMPLFSPKEPRFDPKPAQSRWSGLLLHFDLHFANVPQVFADAVMIRSLAKGQPLIVHQGLLVPQSPAPVADRGCRQIGTLHIRQ
jgi:hypothetical protein